MKLNRRQFLTNAAAAGALAAGAAGTAMAGEATTPEMPEKWDRETDVVVVGSGSIFSAALRAHDEGLDVLILEKHPTWFGGTTAYCGGGMACPNSYLALEAGCREIPRDLIKKYMMDVAEGQTTEELVDMMLDNCSDTIKYLNEECGFQWKSFGVRPEMAYNFYYPFPEIEDEYSDTPCHVVMGTYEPTGANMGGAIIAYAKDAIDARGIEVLMGTAATKLIYSGNPALGDGEVVGVWATDQDGNQIAIKARYAVVLGTGGFDFNKEMVKHYLNHPVYATTAIPTNTGDGHIMAAELGANMRNMNKAFWFAFNVFDDLETYSAYDVTSNEKGGCAQNADVDVNLAMIHPGQCGCFMVNKHGERFMCEGDSYDLGGRAFDAYDTARREWRNIPAFVITDQASCRSTGGASLKSMVESGEFPEWMHVFDTIEELADGIGINKKKLLATVEEWNAACAEGVDEEYLRGEGTWDRYTCGDASRVESGEIKNPCMAPLPDQGPYYCFAVYPGMMATAGGLEINANAQVMNVRGEVIPRLYAGSNCIANTMGRGYPTGGTTIANGLVVGYVAANHIATLEPWE